MAAAPLLLTVICVSQWIQHGAPPGQSGRCSSFDTTPQRPHRRTERPTAILCQSYSAKAGEGLKQTAKKPAFPHQPGKLCSTDSLLSVELNGQRNTQRRGKVSLLF